MSSLASPRIRRATNFQNNNRDPSLSFLWIWRLTALSDEEGANENRGESKIDSKEREREREAWKVGKWLVEGKAFFSPLCDSISSGCEHEEKGRDGLGGGRKAARRDNARSGWNTIRTEFFSRVSRWKAQFYLELRVPANFLSKYPQTRRQREATVRTNAERKIRVCGCRELGRTGPLDLAATNVEEIGKRERERERERKWEKGTEKKSTRQEDGKDRVGK